MRKILKFAKSISMIIYFSVGTFREHLGLTVALRVLSFVCITKIDGTAPATVRRLGLSFIDLTAIGVLQVCEGERCFLCFNKVRRTGRAVCWGLSTVQEF